ncbi:hypothetical protein U9R80_06210 [Pseudomonas sp. JQ170C]|uniref:hypothetical protein n=1 Tax=unclassified Pseudomonas TaxID=196821 RepID=UPI00265ACC87|nr:MULTISPECIES: hypothetical protein [unclassified Pseudomonas]WRO77274.1 hypothetical protein U9R80_06210 [Pseudomonas sp. 170C]
MNFSWFGNWRLDRQLRAVFRHGVVAVPVGSDRTWIIGESALWLHGNYRLPVGRL